MGYDLVLFSLNGLGDWFEEVFLECVKVVGEIIFIFGFYL